MNFSSLIPVKIKNIAFLLVLGAGLFLSLPAFAATLSLSPNTGVYTTGQAFTATVRLNTSGQGVNAAEGVLKFNPSELQVLSLNQSGSIFNLWTIEPTFSNSAGTISFGGGSPRGYTGSAGTIMTITFLPKGSGTTNVTFSSGSALAADGQGTNVLSSMVSGKYTIAAATAEPQPEEIIQYVAPANTPSAPKLTSSTHANPDKWYKDTTASFSWSLPSDVTAVRTSLSDNPGSVPVVVYEPPISSKTLEDLEQGVQYFHIQLKNENGWGKVTHYRLAIDSEKPSKFEISLDEGNESTSNPNPVLVFDVEDNASKVKRFNVQLDGGEPVEYLDETGSSTYKLSDLTPGRHTVVVEAYDEAGNSIVSSFAFNVESFEKPVFTDVPASITADVIPVLIGRTRPDSEVTITVEPKGIAANTAQAAQYTVKSDADGVFKFIPDSSFAIGVYEITAVSIDSFGAQSEPSDPVRLVVSEPGYLKVGGMLIDVLSLLIPLVALALLLVLMLVYMWRRVKTIGGYVRKETKEAEESVTQSFTNLRNILDTHAKTLASSRKTKKLTKAETDLINAMRQELNEAQRRVSKEVSDVDDIVTK